MNIRSFGIEEFLFLVVGMKWTVALSISAFLIGGTFGLILALMRTSESVLLRGTAAAYIEIFRGTPLLSQLFLAYYASVFFGFALSPWAAAVVALSANAAAFLGDIWRGGIQSVPKSQIEAAIALGLNYLDRIVFVIAIPAFKSTLPATVGFVVMLIKGTCLASVLGFMELLRSGQVISNLTFKPLLVFCVVGALYFAICWPVSLFGSWLERRARQGSAQVVSGKGEAPHADRVITGASV